MRREIRRFALSLALLVLAAACFSAVFELLYFAVHGRWAPWA
jgi:hypothetical protein